MKGVFCHGYHNCTSSSSSSNILRTTTTNTRRSSSRWCRTSSFAGQSVGVLPRMTPPTATPRSSRGVMAKPGRREVHPPAATAALVGGTRLCSTHRDITRMYSSSSSSRLLGVGNSRASLLFPFRASSLLLPPTSYFAVLSTSTSIRTSSSSRILLSRHSFASASGLGRMTATVTFAALPPESLVGSVAHEEQFVDWRSWWPMIRKPPHGSGFDSFLPPRGDVAGAAAKQEQLDDNNKDGDDNNKSEGNNHKKKRRGGNSGKNRNSNDDNNGNAWIGLGIVLGLAYMMQRRGSPNKGTDDDTSQHQQRMGGPPRELSWSDFWKLLQHQEILKIIVTDHEQQNAATARIYMKPQHRAAGLHNNSANSLSNNNNNNTDDSWMGSQESDGLMLQQQQPLKSLVSYRMQVGSLEAFERKLDQAQRALGRPESLDVPVQYATASNNTITRELLNVLPGLVLAAVLFGMLRYAAGGIPGGGGGSGGGLFSIGKSTAKKIAKEDIKINFSHVAGCDEAKKEIMEFVDFLKDSERFTKLGAKIPKGALLCGPPGTGKTLLAKAVAGEANVPFYSISGSDFIEMFVGVGPSRVRDLFSEARANAPCIVFIDEIDAVGRQRGKSGVGSNDERENTLNQLLVEMDGFSPTTGVVVLAGTNRVDILDQALTRPGRFDRQIQVDKPDLKGRKDIFYVHLKGITLEGSMEDIAGRLAGLTPGFAGADIANLCNEAAIVAARRKGEKVTMADFEKATDRIIGGHESNKIMSKEERSIVAHHEAGHAVAGWFLEHADALLKVTIIPRSSGALGFAQYLPKEVFLRTQDQIMDIVCMALAGRAAEEIFFGSVTTGASDDLKRVTSLVYSTIQLYGMNSRLGQLSFPKDPNAMFEDRPYSEKTAKVMDEEARAIVDAAYERTLTLLRSKRDEVEKVALLLLEKETITHDDIVTLIGERPFQGDPAYEEFIRKRQSPAAADAADETADITSAATPDDKETFEPPTPLNPGLA